VVRGSLPSLDPELCRQPFRQLKVKNRSGKIKITLIGRDFSTLKTDLGFGEAHDFHSLRRTAIHLSEAEAGQSSASCTI
jgi:hypothetical protein